MPGVPGLCLSYREIRALSLSYFSLSGCRQRKQASCQKSCLLSSLCACANAARGRQEETERLRGEKEFQLYQPLAISGPAIPIIPCGSPSLKLVNFLGNFANSAFKICHMETDCFFVRVTLSWFHSSYRISIMFPGRVCACMHDQEEAFFILSRSWYHL